MSRKRAPAATVAYLPYSEVVALLLSLTYVSSASETLEVPRLREMLAAWRPSNAARGLSGMLLYSGGNIIQTLEGPSQAVDAAYDTIAADPRHHGVLTLVREPVEVREFPDWSMGFRHLSRDEMRTTVGFNPFLQQQPALGSPEVESSAQRLLTLFRENMR